MSRTPTEIFREQLGKSHVCRHTQKWKLFPVEEWQYFFKEDSMNCLCKSDHFVVPAERKSWFLNQIIISDSSKSINTPLEKYESLYIDQYFPGAFDFVRRHQGKLALCGGFFSNPKNTKDVDMFFYNCTPEEAEEIIDDACRFFPEAVKGNSQFENLEFSRCRDTSNLYYRTLDEWDYYNNNKIQFIHRIYPSLAHIIGGFDVQASMVAFDGENILSNEMGAWCFVNKTIVVDISRASPSFAHRLAKYSRRGFNLVYPGFDKTRVESLIDEIQKSEWLAHQKLTEFLDSLNMRTRYWFSDYEEFGSSRIYALPQLETNHAPEVEVMHGTWLKLDRDDRGKIRSRDNPVVSDYGVRWAGIRNQSDHIVRVSNIACLLSNKVGSYSTELIKLDPNVSSDFSAIKEGLKVTDRSVMPKMEDSKFVKGEIRTFELGQMVYEQDLPEEFRIDYDLYKTGNWRADRYALCKFKRNRVEEIGEIISRLIDERYGAFTESLKKITWMTQNPQLQWTSTIHPTLLTAQEFYKGSWTGFTIFPWEILRLFFISRKEKGSVFYRMPKEIIKMILWKTPFVKG